MSTKHTPGPWSASERGTIISATVTREINGTMRTYQSKIATTPAGDRVERLANAQLIAAAPELLDAVREQHDIIDVLLAMLIMADPTFRPTKSEVWPRIAAVGAVQLIAKATGAA